MKHGYARTSTDDQTTALQLAALRQAGCHPIHEDKGVSGAHSQRPALSRCLAALQSGDTLIVWKLDRLGRRLRDLMVLLEDLKQRGGSVPNVDMSSSLRCGRAMPCETLYPVLKHYQPN
jgi:DNA invertase Pin-like site-specific DNA recombinase